MRTQKIQKKENYKSPYVQIVDVVIEQSVLAEPSGNEVPGNVPPSLPGSYW